MKSYPRLWITIIVFSLLAAGCSGKPLLNIPSTGPTAAQGQAGYPAPTVGQGQPGYPAPTASVPAIPGATAYPVPVATDTSAPAPTQTLPALVTATPVVQATNTQPPLITATPAPSATPLGTLPPVSPPPLPSPGSLPLPASRQAVQFPAGASSYSLVTNLGSNQTVAYQVYALAGQRLYLTTDGNVFVQVYGPNLNALTGVLTPINPYALPLNQTGNYYMVLQGSGPVTVSLYIPPAGANQNLPVPLPAQRAAIQFAAGASSTSFTVNLTAGNPQAYTIRALSGQTLSVTTTGNANVALVNPTGTALVTSATMPVHQWQFPLPVTGTYTLVGMGSGSTIVTLSIPPLSATAQPTATSAPQPTATVGVQPTATSSSPSGAVGTPIPMPASSTRITFASGNASTSVTADLGSRSPQAYVLTIQKGQYLYVSTTGSVHVTIYGPDNRVQVDGFAIHPYRWWTHVTQTGDYTFVISGSGTSTVVFYVPPL